MSNHIHVVTKELEAISAMDPDDISIEQSKMLREINEKTEGCAVCAERYRFFLVMEIHIHAIIVHIVANAAIAEQREEQTRIEADMQKAPQRLRYSVEKVWN